MNKKYFILILLIAFLTGCNKDNNMFKNKTKKEEKTKEVILKKVNYEKINLIGEDIVKIDNNDNYKVVSSNEYTFDEHHPTSWKLFGQYFVEGKLSAISKQFHKNTSDGLETLDKEKLKKTIETSFKSFEKEYSSDFTSISFNDIKNVYTNMKNVDPEIRDYLLVLMEELIKYS